MSDAAEKSIDEVYRDRNLLAIAFIRAFVYFRAERRGRVPHGWWPDGDGWAVVWVDLPTGQVGWHVPREMVPEWIPEADPEYDGYTTDEKNDRVRRWAWPR
ncbi:hypothetical protein BRC97_06980 [Halobacteriales archaeon QS_6_71_20]|nr:MAG: hypothetical protein BRC97_06980 [Halobacteriales archaeon QS_6_71_20]